MTFLVTKEDPPAVAGADSGAGEAEIAANGVVDGACRMEKQSQKMKEMK